MFCRKCGKELPSDVHFCHHCGVKLYIPDQPQQPSPPQPATEIASNAVPKKKRITKGKVIAGVVVLVAVIFLILGSQLFFCESVQDQAEYVVYLEIYDDYNNLIGCASGFFIVDGKTLVTNYHVIEGASSITVSSSDGSRSTKATKVIAYDRRADLAILLCNSNIGVKPLQLADSNTAKKGDKIYAVGYPLGLANTMSDGIISSRYTDENNVEILQITAAISPGSSGGALFNERGYVIGVICAYYDGGQNLNLAITSNTVQKLYDNRLKTPISLRVLK